MAFHLFSVPLRSWRSNSDIRCDIRLEWKDIFKVSHSLLLHLITTFTWNVVLSNSCTFSELVWRAKYFIELLQYFENALCISGESRSSPLKLFAIFSLVVNLRNWRFSEIKSNPCTIKQSFLNLSPRPIPICSPVLVHLSEYLYELCHSSLAMDS